MNSTPPPAPTAATPPTGIDAAAPPAQARIRSEDLLRGARELVIEHRGAEYRLLRTRNDRLILNK